MKMIIHEDVMEKLSEHFNDDQLREISFAFNPDCENLADTICKLEDEHFEREEMLTDLKKKIKEMAEQMEEISDLMEDLE